jgi:beta-lactamase class A
VPGPADVLADELDARLSTIAERAANVTLGVSVYDYLSGGAWCFNGDRWFHAASTIRVDSLSTPVCTCAIAF